MNVQHMSAHKDILNVSACNRANVDRFLLIKAFGAGFWCDMEHVAGGLLIAEMTGRIPCIYWGKNSLYGGSDNVNAFEQFFLPVSDHAIHDLMRQDYTVCPDMWNGHNLIAEETQQYIRAWRYPLEVMLSKQENVLVIGWAPLHLIQPWLQYPHPAVGFGWEGIYRYIFEKYIRLQPHIARETDDFYAVHMFNKHILAVHVRISDKITEVKNIHQINKLYYEEIEKYLSRNPSSFIFLLTESAKILNEYKELFKERLLYTECQRTDDDRPIFFKDGTNKIRMGIEVLTDVYLAIRCDAFIGNAYSNVSNAVARLKLWPTDSIKLLW